MILADILLYLFQGIRFTVTYDGKVLLNETLSGEIHLSYKGEVTIRETWEETDKQRHLSLV